MFQHHCVLCLSVEESTEPAMSSEELPSNIM